MGRVADKLTVAVVLAMAVVQCDGSLGSVTSHPTIPGAQPSELQVEPRATVIEPGGQVELAAVFRGGGGMELSSEAPRVRWQTRDVGVARVSPAGVVSGARRGLTTIHASAAGLEAEALIVVQPPLDGMRIAEQSLVPRGVAGSPLDDSVGVRLVDEAGSGVRGVTIRFQAGPGSGTVSPALVTTGSDGYAHTSWTLGTRAGDQEVIATVPVSQGISEDVEGLGDAHSAMEASGDPALRAVVPGRALPGEPDVVTVTPARPLIPVGGWKRLEADVRDRYRNPVAVSEVSWTSGSKDVLTVDRYGVARGLSRGSTEVAARAGEAEGSARVTVHDGSEEGDRLPLTPDGIWVSPEKVATLPASGAAWENLRSEADGTCPSFDLSDQDSENNTCVMAKALMYARTGDPTYLDEVTDALRALGGMGTYDGRALALGRNLGAYAIAADLIDLQALDRELDDAVRQTFRELLSTRTYGAASDLVDCHERRPNNWGTHCGASRATVAAYLGDWDELDRTARVFRGWLGDRSAHSGFAFGGPSGRRDHSWECHPDEPVGINPKGCTHEGHNIDGVIPDDQRRGGPFSWPPPRELYVWEALQGALVQAVVLHRAGYDVFEWEDRAILRALRWLHEEADFHADAGNTWQPHLANHFYGASFPAPVPSRPGKNVGWTDWTHGHPRDSARP